MAKKKLWIALAGVVSAPILLGGIAIGVAVASANSHINAQWDVTPPVGTFATGDDQLAEGARLYRARGCADCHGADGAGVVFIEGPVGRFIGANLTTGAHGIAADYSDLDFVRSIRHGIGTDGQALLFMPSHEFWGMSDRDMGALLTHIRALPPVDTEPDDQQVGLLGKVLYAAGQFPLIPAEMVDHARPRNAEPVVAATVEYGAYLAEGCRGCHGANLSGGAIPGAPPDMPIPTNITPHESGLQGWTAEHFEAAMRTGVRPDGTNLNPFMPWANLALMTDTEIDALWAYLQTVPASEEGLR
jgi:mono/diheme cytochrome c family protein